MSEKFNIPRLEIEGEMPPNLPEPHGSWEETEIHTEASIVPQNFNIPRLGWREITEAEE